MNARKEFDQMLKKTSLTDQEFHELKRLLIRQTRKTAIVFGVWAITTLIAFVFAFVANSALKVSREDARHYEQRAVEAEAWMIKTKAQIQDALVAAEAARAEAERRLVIAQEKSKSTNSKK
jgi:phosphate/sulfate permease